MGTELKNWRLRVENGRQTWHYIENELEQKNWPQTFVDKYWLNIREKEVLDKQPNNQSALEAARKGLRFCSKLQTEDGHFAGEYGGPMFLIPGLVIVMYVTVSPFPAGFKHELVRYLMNRANEIDGGFGMYLYLT
jgi:lanosterol synthase